MLRRDLDSRARAEVTGPGMRVYAVHRDECEYETGPWRKPGFKGAVQISTVESIMSMEAPEEKWDNVWNGIQMDGSQWKSYPCWSGLQSLILILVNLTH